VKEAGELADAVGRANAEPGPALVEFMIEQEANVFPMIPPGAPSRSRSRRRRPAPQAIERRARPLPSAHTVAVLLDDALVTLNRAFGVLRRRNVPIEGLALHPSGTAGEARLTFVLKADAATTDRLAQQFHKMIGVRSVMVLANEDSTTEAKR